MEFLQIEDLCKVYGNGENQVIALNHVSLSIEKGEFTAIIGSSGSGKSTLIQHFNGLERPKSGNVFYNNENIYENNYDLRKLRCKVGLVFQYPEHQLFEETVLKDVCFGPMNMGMSREEAEKKAKLMLEQVGINEKCYNKSPFELSGGQKRRVAIAGVLAMNPEIIVLDEPTAGLDPKGRDKILNRIKELHDNTGIGVVLVSHSMEDVANYAQRLIVINNGKIKYDGMPKDVFKHYKELEKMGLKAPQITYIMHKLKEKGLDVDENVITIEEARENIMQCLNRKDI